MDAPTEEALDRLYAAPPDRFTAERDALARGRLTADLTPGSLWEAGFAPEAAPGSPGRPGGEPGEAAGVQRRRERQRRAEELAAEAKRLGADASRLEADAAKAEA